jgi:hypothetical protein
MPKVRIRPFAGKGKERGFTFSLRHELKILALKASWLWNHRSIKGVHPGFLSRLEECRIQKGKRKAQKIVQLVTIFVNPSALQRWTGVQGMLRVDPEGRFLPRSSERGLNGVEGSRKPLCPRYIAISHGVSSGSAIRVRFFVIVLFFHEN